MCGYNMHVYMGNLIYSVYFCVLICSYTCMYMCVCMFTCSSFPNFCPSRISLLLFLLINLWLMNFPPEAAA